MTTPGVLKAPFPWFGGKSRIASRVWALLGDPAGYVEPFCGSAAVLLARPSGGSERRVETLNDADGWLVNLWRALRLSPDVVARYAYGPVTEIDYHARLAWLQARRTPDLVSWLEGDPEHHDAKAAGWWLTVVAAGIGNPFDWGPWSVIDGHLRRTGNAGNGINRELPHLGNAGMGINRELPHLGNAGMGTQEERLCAYLAGLSRRLASVRITCGDWLRVVTPSVTRPGVGGDRARALFLDPPYATSGDLYASGDGTVATSVREWCMSADRNLRIVLCGYEEEHDALLARGWRKELGRGSCGYSLCAASGRRERLWISPACLCPDQEVLL